MSRGPAATTARRALVGTLATAAALSLSACGSGSSKEPTAQKTVAGCDIPTSWPPEGMLQEMVVEGFRDEHAVKDPKALSDLNTLFAHGRAMSDLNFGQWYGANENSSAITVRGLTMGKWELYFKVKEFPNQADIYPAICGGWTFESYLQKHPDVDKSAVDAAIAGSKPTHT